MLSCGIVGLPNVGKSTLFNALRLAQGKLIDELSGGAKIANYPFTTIEPNVGVVEVPDGRLQKLAEVVALDLNKDKEASFSGKAGSRSHLVQDDSRSHLVMPPIVPAVVKFVDIAGLVKGAAKGEGLGNQFLSHIREVEVIVFVLRDFKNEDVVRAGSETPKEDLEVLKSELLLKDLETLTNQISKKSRFLTKSKNQNDSLKFKDVIEKAKSLVEQGRWLAPLTGEELEQIADLQLLSSKKTLSIINSDEEDLNKESPLSLKETPLRISAKLEEELASLDKEDQNQYLKELGIDESGLDRLIKRAYETLGLITFFTAGPKEVRAWTIKRGTLAPAAAGVIHSDFEKGFIAAEVCTFEDFVSLGGWRSAKEKGLVKTIGRAEEIKDGMVVEFKFSV